MPVRIALPKTTAALLLAVVSALAAALGDTGAHATAFLPTVYFNYSTSCTFTVTNDEGQTVTTMPPGTYQVLIDTPGAFGNYAPNGPGDMTDCNGSVNFQLTGPGVYIASTLDDGDDSEQEYSATFEPSSTYTAVDLNQPSVAIVTFSTAASGTPVVPPPTASGTSETSGGGKSVLGGAIASSSTTNASKAILGTLSGSVSSSGKLALLLKGKAVSVLAAGRYTLKVRNSSTTLGFALGELNAEGKVIAHSTTRVEASKSVTVTLTEGQWFFASSARAKARSYFIVTA